MTTATTQFDNETGYWTVTDEYGHVWDAVTTSDLAMLLQREDGERFYGATWTGSDGRGSIGLCDDGAVRDGFDCNDRYTFSGAHGWSGEQE